MPTAAVQVEARCMTCCGGRTCADGMVECLHTVAGCCTTQAWLPCTVGTAPIRGFCVGTMFNHHIRLHTHQCSVLTGIDPYAAQSNTETSLPSMHSMSSASSLTRERPGGTPPGVLERRGVGLGDALASLALDLDRMSLDARCGGG